MEQLYKDVERLKEMPMDIHKPEERRKAYFYLDTGPYRRYRYKVNSILNETGISSLSVDELWSLLDVASTYREYARQYTDSDREHFGMNTGGMAATLIRDISLIQRAIQLKTNPNALNEITIID